MFLTYFSKIQSHEEEKKIHEEEKFKKIKKYRKEKKPTSLNVGYGYE